MNLLILCALLFGFNASASFLPEDFKIDYQSLPKGKSNITKAEFDQILNDIKERYTSIVSAHGGKLSMQGEWNNEKLNAGARQMFGTWTVMITGGLARRPELTKDGFALIVCHELGHHLGGFAFAPSRMPFEGVWAATEGQSDYFSTHVCAPEIWRDDWEQNAKFRDLVDAEAKSKCDEVYFDIASRDLCYRINAGVESMVATMAAIKKVPMPSFATPDQNVVDKTNPGHPEVQCRLDTAFQGSLCAAPFNTNIIPGKNAPGGQFSREAEIESANNSCTQYGGFEIGLRPSCWYKSNL